MSDRKETTKILTEAVIRHINPKNDTRIYYATEVTFDYATAHSIRVDVVQYKPGNMDKPGGIEKGKVYCFEVKSCIEDYKSGHGLNYIGDFNYIVTLPEVFEKIKEDLKWTPVGVYVYENNKLVCARKAKECDRNYSISEILLMMFRSANRENIKHRKEKAV